MKVAFQQIKSELLAASGRDFERQVYPWLKILFPELVLPTGLKGLDRKGVDMAYVTPGAVLPVVIQCKGFEVTSVALSGSQVDQVGKSVQTFVKSKLRCQRYILLYNRGGDNRDFAADAKAKLTALTSSAAADTVELWSLDSLIK